MNPLFKDKLFLSIAVPTVLLLVWSTVGVTANVYGAYKLVILGSTQDWHTAVELYQIPLSIAVGLFGIFALFTSIHRLSLQSAQTSLQSLQVDEARKLNEFNIYFKQREEFDKKFQMSMAEWFKSVQRNTNIRNHEWFEDFDVRKWMQVDVEPEKLNRVAGITCFNLYEFSFGSGRRIYSSNEFKRFVSQIFAYIEQISQISDANNAKEAKIKTNTLIVNKLSKSGKFSDWCGLYHNEWFSVNEKFNLSLAIARLFSEIEAFAGEPRQIECISKVTESGQSAEQALFFGPNLLMGERRLSPGGLQGRVPNLLSRILSENVQNV